MSFKTPVIIFMVVAGVFLFEKTTASASYDFNENCREIYRAVFDLRFQTAGRLIRLEEQCFPSNLIPLSLENTRRCMTLFISEDPALFRYYSNRRSEIGEKLKIPEEKSPFNIFLRAKYHLDWAFAEVKFHEFYKAAIDLRKAYALFEENNRLWPDFLINKTGLGILHVSVGMIPEQYRWIVKLTGMDGSVELGISELQSVAFYKGNDSLVKLYQSEALFYLTFIAMNAGGNQVHDTGYDALLTGLQQDSAQSPLMIFAKASILMKAGKNPEALKILMTRKNLSAEFPFRYLDYLEGVAKLNMLDYKADMCFQTYLNNFKGTNYRAASMQKIAWISFLKGEVNKYHELMQRIKSVKQLWTDEDKQASAEAVRGELPNISLLKARLLFDGGYYNESLLELTDRCSVSQISSSTGLIEYYYRLGRIFQMKGDESNAIKNFNATLVTGRVSEAWFPAAAAFQLGCIYEKNNDWNKAEKYYRECLTMNNREYRNSLRQKSKIGIERIREKL